jgi:DNA-binding LytR/AlgR family response regulator
MTALIIDDEPLARQGLEIMLKNIPSLTIAGSFGSAIDASIYLQQKNVDLIFLDINMPEMNGMDFVKSMVNKPLIIFVTAYPQYALESYELDAVDYLVKPIRLERLLKAINKAESYLKLLAPSQETSLIDSVGLDYVFVKADRKFTKLFFKDILFIEGLKDYVVIKLANKKVITAMNIKTVAAQLPEKIFVRINKSFIVNLENIDAVDSFYVYIQEEEIPIGESFKTEFLSKYIIDKTISRK